ncbi:MAG: hypothetical protein PHN75_18655 [Syntrophales bacterium]|nr:hypothetical protein [Syntrophales bacterium]
MMKKLLIGILLIGICAGTAWADSLQDMAKNQKEAVKLQKQANSTIAHGSPCDTNPYRVCGAIIDGETFYMVRFGECRKGAIEWYIVDYYGKQSLDEARMKRDLENASEYAKCEANRKYEKKVKTLEETVWIEIK